MAAPSPLPLRPEVGGARWVLEGDPQVARVAERLFPGARSQGPGRASFPNTPRAMQDLAWLMQRYPVAAADGYEAELRAAAGGAREHAVRRAEAAARGPASAWDLFVGTARPYQEEALAFMLANRKTLLADDMGWERP